MEIEIRAYEEDENFNSYKISWLINSNFGGNPQKSCAFTSISLTRPQSAAILSAPVQFALLSSTPGLSTPGSANIPIYSIYILGIGPPPSTYIKPLDNISGAYIQPSEQISLAYVTPLGTRSLLLEVYTQSLGIKPIPPVYGLQ